MKMLAVIALSIFVLSSCKDPVQHECYDETIVHTDVCTEDCPGIEGCDGKTYCNECIAAREGIRPK